MTALEQHTVRSIHLPFAIIAITNLLGWFHLAPVFVQLLLNSSCCVYVGCVLSSKLQKKASGELGKVQKNQQEQEESIDMREAMKFPIIASIFLFGFYILYKFVNKDIVNFLLTLQFSLATVISTSNMLLDFVNFSDSMKKTITHVNPPNFLKKYLDFQEFDISLASIFTTGVCAIPVILFFITKHWLLNNIFGILFSVVALKNINISSFKVGFILLWALFFYDIFWVYGTDVMVTVAKNLDIPIKLIFPYANDAGEQKFSMLGLGDIVVPGIFVSLCLKFDIDRCLKTKPPKAPKDVRTDYFNVCVIGYIAGILETFAVMWYFEHPQPALLFLVPMCTIPIAGLAFFKGQLKVIQEYTTEDPGKEKKQIKEEDKGLLDKLFDKISGAPKNQQSKDQ